jgi:LmbE family N-acetylglucosaminyl deacetylase
VGASHPDHRAVGSAALDAVYPDARNPFAFLELAGEERLPAWTVGEVWIAGSPAPDHYVDVTGTFPRKLAALRAHESQTGHLTDLEARLRERLARLGRARGPGGRPARRGVPGSGDGLTWCSVRRPGHRRTPGLIEPRLRGH